MAEVLSIVLWFSGAGDRDGRVLVARAEAAVNCLVAIGDFEGQELRF